MTRIFALIIKETKLLVREPASLMLLFIIPTIFVIILSVALQGAFTSINDPNSKINILMLNNDRGSTGKKLIKEFKTNGKFNVITKSNDELLTRDKIVKEINNGNYEIGIIIPRGSTSALSSRVKRTIEILVDPALGNEFSAFIKGTVQKFIHISVISKLTGRSSNRLKKESSKGLYVKQIYTSIKGDEVFPNSVQQNVPGWTIFALFWIAQTLALNMINERLSGAYKRILITPISWPGYIIGKMIPFFIVNIIQAVFLFTIGVYLLPYFGCPELIITNIPGLIILTVAISIAAICLGIFFASISNSLFSVATLSVLTLIIMTILGGIMVPKLVMPEFMKKMTLFVPQGWALDGYHNILVRDYSVFQILENVGILIAFAIFFLSVSFIFFKQKKYINS